MSEERKFYRVANTLYGIRLPSCLEYGYESDRDFRHALWELIYKWKDRIGECIEERYGLLLLRFHDTPGGMPDEAWLPTYLLTQTDMPEYVKEAEREPDELERELDEAFGFD